MVNRSIAPPFGEISAFSFLPVEKELADNLVPCFFVNGGTEDVLRIDFVFDAGSRLQNKTCQAVAVSNLITEGTINKTSAEIAEMFDSLGAFTQSSCSADDSVFTLYCLNKHLKKCLELVLEVLNFASFPEKELDIYRSTQIQRLQVNEQKTSYQSRKSFFAAIFGKDHPYGRSATMQAYNDLTRSDLLSFFTANYGKSSLKVIGSGKINSEERNLIHSLINRLNSLPGKKENFSAISSASSADKKIFIQKDGSIQSSIKIGRKLFNRTDPDYRPFQLLNLILGGYFGSRLMKNIREEKGLTYGIYSSVESYLDGGSFYISTDVNNDLRDTAVNEIYKELEKIMNEPIPENELTTAKNYLLGSFLRSLDGAFAQSERVKLLSDYGLEMSYYTEFISIIKTTSSKTLMLLANKYLNRKDLYEVICGS